MSKFCLYLYDKDREPPYETFGAVISNAENCVVTYVLNGVSTLEFTIPLNGKLYRMLKANNIVVYEGKPFRMKLFEDSHEPNVVPKVRVTAYDFLQDLNDYVIPDFFMIGKTPREIVAEACKDTPFHVLTAAELPEGMEWWDVPTDMELGRTTPSDAITKMMEATGGGEIYLDGYNIAVVKAIGKEAKRPIKLGVNLKGIKRTVDARDIITRVIPMGQDDLHIDYVTAGNQQYIDSKWQEVFGVIEGYVDYSDIAALGEDDDESYNGASVLYWTAIANMDAPIPCGGSNLKADKNKYVNTAGIRNKLDLPIVEYEIGITDLAFLEDRTEFAYHLGDVVNVVDEVFAIDTGNPREKDYMNLTQQIIEMKVYPYEPLKNSVTLGQHKQSYMKGIYDGKAASDYIGNHTTTDGDIREDAGEGTDRTDNLTITPPGWASSSVAISDRFGVRSIGHVYYDDYRDPTAAVAISKSVLAMGRKVGGKWQWNNVIANGMGNLDSRMWVGSLSTTLVDIMSDDGCLSIQNNLIVMKDNNGVVRLKEGLDNGKYVFELRNAQNEKTIYIDDNGNAVFCGLISGSQFEGGIFQVLASEDRQTTGIQFQYKDSRVGFDAPNAGRIVLEDNPIGGPEFKIEANNGVQGVLNGLWKVDERFKVGDKVLMDVIGNLTKKIIDLQEEVDELKKQNGAEN